MGFGKKFKRAVGKTINKITGGSKTLNKILGFTLAVPTGGASFNAANQATRMQMALNLKKAAEAQAAEAQAAEARDAEARAADNANKEFITSVNRQREASLLGKTKTDYTGDLSEDYEDSEETVNKLLSRPLITKRRKLLGM